MNNYLIYDPISGGEFFVQADNPDELVAKLQSNGYDVDECKLRSLYNDDEAEVLGLDTL